MMTIKQIEVTVGEITRGYINNDEQGITDNSTYVRLTNVSLYIMRKSRKPSLLPY